MIRRLHVPLLEPKDVQRHLAEWNHWRAGYSAQELSYSWAAAHDTFPRSVSAVLRQAEEYRNALLVDGFFEREVKLRTPGKNSQTDLMVVADLGSELAIIAVEGKVREPFNEIVRKWNDSPGKQKRLEDLCELLRLQWTDVGSLRYQLFHRVASAIHEAHRYHARHAMLLVHSFSADHTSFDDFGAFARAIELPVQKPNSCSEARSFEGVSVRLAWVSDLPRSQATLQTMEQHVENVAPTGDY